MNKRTPEQFLKINKRDLVLCEIRPRTVGIDGGTRQEMEVYEIQRARLPKGWRGASFLQMRVSAKRVVAQSRGSENGRLEAAKMIDGLEDGVEIRR